MLKTSTGIAVVLRGIVTATTALPSAPVGHRVYETLVVDPARPLSSQYYRCECGVETKHWGACLDHVRAIADRDAADSEAARRIAARHTAALAHAHGHDLVGLLEYAQYKRERAKSYEAASRLGHLVDAIKNLIDAFAERAWVDAVLVHNADTHGERRGWKSRVLEAC